MSALPRLDRFVRQVVALTTQASAQAQQAARGSKAHGERSLDLARFRPDAVLAVLAQWRERAASASARVGVAEEAAAALKAELGIARAQLRAAEGRARAAEQRQPQPRRALGVPSMRGGGLADGEWEGGEAAEETQTAGVQDAAHSGALSHFQNLFNVSSREQLLPKASRPPSRAHRRAVAARCVRAIRRLGCCRCIAASELRPPARFGLASVPVWWRARVVACPCDQQVSPSPTRTARPGRRPRCSGSRR